MIVPIRCFSCGNLIANRYNLYTQIVKIENMINKISDTDVDADTLIRRIRENNYSLISNKSKKEELETVMNSLISLVIDSDIDFDSENNNNSKKLALDAVGLSRYCCRMQILGTRNIIDVVATDRKNI